MDLIEGYYIFDDRSKRSDLIQFKRDFPQFRIFCCDKGQAYSLSKIWEFTKNDEWYFHCEDDWEFLLPGHYIRDCMAVAKMDTSIRNVILRGWQGVYIVEKLTDYYIHTHKLLKKVDVPNGLLWEFCLRTDNQWYGLSFNPGIIHTRTIVSLGGVGQRAYNNPDLRGWDKELAIKYLESGFKRANLTKEYISHIGEGKKSLYKGN